MNLPNDAPRCAGYHAAHICTTCERKAQIERDDPAKFYWTMPPAVDRGRCSHYIAPDVLHNPA